MPRPSILFVVCDAYLAGIYGRKFELDGWDVEVVEEIADGERKAVKMRPDIMIVDTGCVVNIGDATRRLRSMPTLLNTKVVVLATESRHAQVQAALAAGADDFLLVGHFVPQEMLGKMKKLMAK